MRAKETMLGDILCTKDGEKFHIVEIQQNYVNASKVVEAWVKDCDIQGLPITEAILKANGFTEQPDVPEGCVNWVYNNGGQIVYISRLPWDSFSIDANFHGRLSMTIQYVHEVQHILRLIGINHLADNFKIQ